jgi:L-asparaginase
MGDHEPIITVGPVVVKPRDPSALEQRCVAVLNTGGTIGMKANAHGSLEPSPGYLAERICAMSEFKRADMPAVDLYELLPLLDSSDMGPADWIRIAQMIETLFYNYDGFVVVMGTDTMAYCGSALSFLLENLNKPVILTGAMLPLVDLFNDAHRNLIVSITLASILDVPEVCIFINDKLMRGNRTVKVSSSGLDAFDSPNFPPLALLETGIRFRPHLCLPQPRGRFRVNKALSTAVAVWRMVPGFDDHYIRVSIRDTPTLRAIVLELYGTGNLSARKSTLIDALTEAIEKGIIIVATSQCLRGTVNLSAYSLGKKLEAIGVVQAGDMTTEAVCAKLAYLMAQPGITREQVICNMGRNLRGEITESKPVMALGSRGMVMGASSGTLQALGGAANHSLMSPVSQPPGGGHHSQHGQPHHGGNGGSGAPGAFSPSSAASAPARLVLVPNSPDPYTAVRADPDSIDFYSSASIVHGKHIPTVPADSSPTTMADAVAFAAAASNSHGWGQHMVPSPAPSVGSTASSLGYGGANNGIGAGAVPIKITGDAASGESL